MVINMLSFIDLLPGHQLLLLELLLWNLQNKQQLVTSSTGDTAARQQVSCSEFTVCFHGSSKGVLSGHQCSITSWRRPTVWLDLMHRQPPLPPPPPPAPPHLLLLSHLLLWFGDDLLLLGQDHLDVAGGAHVGVDASVGTVRAPPHLGGLVHLDVLNNQRVHIQTLKPEPDRNRSETRTQQLSATLTETLHDPQTARLICLLLSNMSASTSAPSCDPLDSIWQQSVFIYNNLSSSRLTLSSRTTSEPGSKSCRV